MKVISANPVSFHSVSRIELSRVAVNCLPQSLGVQPSWIRMASTKRVIGAIAQKDVKLMAEELFLQMKAI